MNKRQTLQLRDFLKDWLQFRVFVRFKDGNKRHIFGKEWPPRITIEQVIWKHVVEIKLNRIDGYNDLVNAIESGFMAGQYKEATIFMRDHTKKFNIPCRFYKEGKLDIETVNDPTFGPEEETLILYPSINNASRTIEFMPANFFKAEVNKHLVL